MFALLCAIGLAVRLFGLPAWGTFDTEIYKAWAVRGARSLADIYGPADREIVSAAGGLGPLLSGERRFPRTVFTWGHGTYFVDYPGGAVLILAAAGKLYEALRPGSPNQPLFNAVINLGPLLASAVIGALLYWSGRQAQQRRARSLSFWLNPAVIFAAPFLGYNDPIFSAFAVGAVLAMARGSLPLAAGLVTAAALIKPQAVLLAPVIFGLLANRGERAAWRRSFVAGAITALVILAPWWTQGHLLSSLDGFRRPFEQQSLAPLGLNVWWIAGWVVDWLATGGSTLARIWAIDDFTRAAGFDPRWLARAAVAGGALAVFVLVWKRRIEGEGFIALAAIVMIHSYALLSTSVHENHTFLAVALAPLLLGAIPSTWRISVAMSSFLALSLFFAAGLGRRVTRLRTITDLRFEAGLDPTVILAALHIVLVIALWTTLLRVTQTSRRGFLTA